MRSPQATPHKKRHPQTPRHISTHAISPMYPRDSNEDFPKLTTKEKTFPSDATYFKKNFSYVIPATKKRTFLNRAPRANVRGTPRTNTFLSYTPCLQGGLTPKLSSQGKGTLKRRTKITKRYHSSPLANARTILIFTPHAKDAPNLNAMLFPQNRL